MANHHVGGAGYNYWRPIIRQRARREGIPCWLCGKPFYWEVDPKHPMSFTIHHIVDRHDGGDRDDPANMVPAHLLCNQKDYGDKARQRAAAQRGSTTVRVRERRQDGPKPTPPPQLDQAVSDRWK